MEDFDQKQHWGKIYETKEEHAFSWFQEYPATSVDFLSLFNLPRTANIIDIGGGDSHFADALIELGYENIWVLDISEKSIERARARLGQKGNNINWVVSDILDFTPGVKFDFWHDRAAFHFLTSDSKIEKYVAIAEMAIKPDGYLILGAFSENGPQKCSGLEIKQYSEAAMSGRFNKSFEKIKCIEEIHTTPFATQQSFLFCSFKMN